MSEQAVAEVQEIQKAEQRLSPEKIHAAIIRAGNLKVLESPNVTFNPSEYNPEELQQFGIDKEMMLELFRYLVKFLNTPTMQDGFGNDQIARHRFRDEMYDLYGNEADTFLGNNKLKSNKLNLRLNLTHYARILFNGLRGQKNAIHDVFQHAVEDLSWMRKGEYETFLEEEKLAHVREADQIARNILELFKKEELVLKEFAEFVSAYANLPKHVRSSSVVLSDFMARLDPVVSRMQRSPKDEIKSNPLVMLLYKKRLSLQQAHAREKPSPTWQQHIAEDTDLAAQEILKAFSKVQ